MTHQTKVGLAVAAASLSTCGGGALLVKHAHALPGPSDFPVTMGWMLIGCGAFGLLLALGIIFSVDRSYERAE